MKSSKGIFYLIVGVVVIFVSITFVLSILGQKNTEDAVYSKDTTNASSSDLVKEKSPSVPSSLNKTIKQEVESKEVVDGVAYYTPKKWDPKGFAPSLVGTEIDGGLKADVNGNLIVDRDIKDFFDYLFLAAPDAGGVAVIDKIKEISSSNLPEEAHDQAMNILEDYLVYKEEVAKIDSRSFDGEDRVGVLKSTLAEIENLQNSIFSPEVTDHFFGEEKAYAKYTIKNMEIMADENISVEQRRQMIENNRMTLSEDVRAVMEEANQEKETYEKVREVSGKINDPESIKYELISKGVPEETAVKIAENKRQEKQFEQKYSVYKNELSKYRDLSSSEFEKMRSTLIEQHFENGSERTRAKLKDLSN